MRSGITCMAVAIPAIIMLLSPQYVSPDRAADESVPCHGPSCQRDGNNLHISSSGGRHRSLFSAIYDKYFGNEVEEWLTKKQTELENSVFISYDSSGVAYKSTQYQYVDFINALYSMSVIGVGPGDEPLFFYLGQTDEKGIVHGMVNLAAFLAHAMARSIKYDLCDEPNVDKTDMTEKYAISNSCGQYGHSYQDEVCVGDDAFMTCDVDPNMKATADSSLGWENSPPPLQCGPKESPTDFTGHWDAELGALSEVYPYANRVGVMHYEGCCWWGRGVLFTRGTCSFGRMNHYLGRKAAENGYLNFYDVDLCYPQVICTGEDTLGLRWRVGFFEWLDRVETYQNAAVNYRDELDTFVESGFFDVNRFIDVVGDALPFDCMEASCMAAEEQLKQERRDNFINLVFNVLDLPFLYATTPFPTPPPTRKPAAGQQPDMSTSMTNSPEQTPPPMTIIGSNPPEPSSPVPQPSPPVAPDSTPTSPPSRSTTVTPEPTQQPTEKLIPQTPVPTTKPPTQNPTIEPTARPQTPKPTRDLAKLICVGQPDGYIPVDECTGYVQCTNGNKVAETPCAPGLLFDSGIGQCNWAATVIVCNAPTNRPTPPPTNAPSPRPTRRPTAEPRPTNEPTTGAPVVQPPEPVNSIRPIYQLPESTARPTEQPFSVDNDGQSDAPTYYWAPSDGGPELINLPSSASFLSLGVSLVLLALSIVLVSAGH